ncbi:MAG TPA: Rap1a/Tai family immunity protein [Alphaproteobacteria bacterium]
MHYRLMVAVLAATALLACAPRPLTFEQEAARQPLPETVRGFVALCRPLLDESARLTRQQRIDGYNCSEVMRGAAAAQAEWLKDNKPTADDYCIPPDATARDQARAFLDWAARNPDKLDSRDGPFTDAWREAFPCPR